MEWLPTTFAILSLIGFAFDKILLRRLKVRVYDWLQDTFIRLDDIYVYDYPRLVGKRVLEWKNTLFGESLITMRSLLLTMLISWLLVSTIAIYFHIASPLSRLSNPSCCEDFHLFDVLPFYPFYVINFFTDFLSLVITTFAVRGVLKLSSKLSAIILILNGIVGIVLMIITFSAVNWVAYNAEKLPLTDRLLSHQLQSSNVLLYFSENRSSAGTVDRFFTSFEDVPAELQPYFQKAVVESGNDPKNIDYFHVHIADCNTLTSCIIYSTSEFFDSFIAGYQVLTGNSPYQNDLSRSVYVSLIPQELAEYHSNYIEFKWLDTEGMIVSVKTFFSSDMSMFGVLSTTTLIPATLIIILILMLGLFKIVHVLLIKLAMYFTEKITENDPNNNEKLFLPGTTIGVLIGVIGEIATKLL